MVGVMKTLLLLTLASACTLTTSCNTMIGIGRDMRLAGEGMEKIATKASGQSTAQPDTSGAPVY